MDDEIDDQASVTLWLTELRGGNQEAAERIWSRYFEKLMPLAKRHLGTKFRKVSDEEDLASSVLWTVIQGAQEGRFVKLKDRHDLWCLLLAITKRKSIDVIRYETRKKRGGGKVASSSEIDARNPGNHFILDDLLGEDPTPDFLVALEDQHQFLLDGLRDERMRDIATGTLEGFSAKELADRHKVSERTVKRKLELIRTIWTEAFNKQ